MDLIGELTCLFAAVEIEPLLAMELLGCRSPLINGIDETHFLHRELTAESAPYSQFMWAPSADVIEPDHLCSRATTISHPSAFSSHLKRK
jgi:hypothetical protein